MTRAQQGAEQYLSAAGLGDEAISGVSEAIIQAAKQEVEGARPHDLPTRTEPPASAPEPKGERLATPEQPRPPEPSAPMRPARTPRHRLRCRASKVIAALPE